jgi:flagellar assembly protein FliH
MKAWGSKKIMRGDDVPPLEPWLIDEFRGASVQRPHYHPERQQPDTAETATAVAEAESAQTEPAEPEVEVAEPQVDLEAELAAARQAGHQEGYRTGHDAGWREGYGAGEQAGKEAGLQSGQAQGLQQGRAEAADEVSRFRDLLGVLESTVAAYENRLAVPIQDLAIAIARQMLRTTLAVEPERIQAVIREALASLPELQPPLRLELHPDDVALVHALFAQDAEIGQWRFEADPQIERGGCRISNAVAEVDLTLPARWRRIVGALGRQDAWTEADEQG